MSSNKSSASLIATIALAAVATAAVVLLLIFMNKGKEPDTVESTPSSGFSVTSELNTECADAAQKLVSDNYEIIRLFVTEGLPLKSVYGKAPEAIDGVYEIASDKYTEYSQIETLVKSVYTDEAAETILTKNEIPADGGAVKKVRIYDDHDLHGDKFFGVIEEFSADESYKRDWSDCFIVTAPESEDKCAVTVYTDGVSAEEAESHPESVLKTTMVKTSSGWRLTSFLK